MSDGPKGLSGDYDLLPDSQAYKFEDVYNEESGESSLISKRTQNEPIIAEVIQLETAKKKADQVSSTLITATTREQFETGSAVVTMAQRNVSSHRLALLKAMMDKAPDIELCQDTTEECTAGRKLCVSYTRFASENDELLHQTQSQCSWVLPGQTADIFDEIIHTSDEVGNSKRLHTLLHLATISCPTTRWTSTLRNLLHDHRDGKTDTPAFQHQWTHVALSANWQKTEASAVPFKGYTATKQTQNGWVKFTGMPSIANLNVCDYKQSAYIRSLVRKTILYTALNIRDEVRRFHCNLFRVSVKIATENETHVLTFMPFAGPERCTVSHLQFKQPMRQTIDLSETLGILQINEDDIDNIRSLDNGEITAMDAYTCIGAYRQTRFNEQELNYIHLQGMEENDIESAYFTQYPLEINYDIPIPPAKAARISGTGWDVLVTSWLDTTKNEVATTITAINYPPYGTQLEYAHKKQNSSRNEHSGPGNAVVKDKWLVDTPDKDFFVRGIVGTPHDQRLYLVLVAPNNPAMRRRTRERAVEIRNMISASYSNVWDANKNFFGNLEYNDRVDPANNMTIREVWSNEWKKTINDDIASWYRSRDGTFILPGGDTYWWAGDTSVWRNIITDRAMLTAWTAFLGTLAPADGVASQKRPSRSQPALAEPGMIRLPRRQAASAPPAKTAAKTGPEITQMQARIQALEAKLDRSRQEANNAHLLQEVLSKLDRPSALRY